VHLVKVLEQLDRIEALGGSVVVVVYDAPARVRAGLLQGLEVTVPVLVDAQRVAYRAWGLERAGFARIWLDPSVWGRYARVALHERRLPRLGTDTRQLGGDLVVDAGGVVRYACPQRRDVRPPVLRLLAELDRARAA
jgi:hypothetical protein